MQSRLVEISKFNDRELEKNEQGIKVIPDKDSAWITIKWFHSEDYESQERLNDDSEIFAQDIVNNTNVGVYVRVQSVKLSLEGGKYKKFIFTTEHLFKHEKKLIQIKSEKGK